MMEYLTILAIFMGGFSAGVVFWMMIGLIIVKKLDKNVIAKANLSTD